MARAASGEDADVTLPDSPASSLSRPLPFPAHLPAGTEMTPTPRGTKDDFQGPSLRMLPGTITVQAVRQIHHLQPPSAGASLTRLPTAGKPPPPEPQLPSCLFYWDHYGCPELQKGPKRGKHIADVLQESIAAA